ncbi:type IV toxin-antitoxin system AbiEi family antitoxin domain-containing protein [Enterococcus sp. 669A]|uniref:Type IV toxin-antitoxin system AbiEi family antitoxin domain-containing protein n=1 Tax=Candidatus Enterococcus moelleringii TaxID=2815325 RepID=A0ABS3LDI2_9ENTE|nr:type IV toxin-antitoxin system AbiEi family antitoxin domain-containing protein [Enterococcus sp. 669A]MBO1307700.1 type IV toxin-antitoxin system AbiEi family antitoxin domain-containing protein [Enterococcus sp. 669A]
MSNKQHILRLGKEQNGVITSKMVTDLGYSRKALSQLEDEKLIFRVERGIYVMASNYVDHYLIIQQRLPQGIFSHETALYLLGYTESAPEIIHMTFPRGFNTSRAKKVQVQPIIASNELTTGITSIERSNHAAIKVYEIERTLIDLLKSKYKADKELLMSALKQYIRSDACNIAKLNDYARLFKLEAKIQPYLEILL